MSVIARSIPAVVTQGGKTRARYSSRNGAQVRLIIFHTAEGARNCTSLGGWFRNPAAPNASSHVGIDDREVVQYVPPEFSAWTAASANPVAEQAELCAFASWTKAEWDAHPEMVENAARWLAERAAARGIPLVRLRAGATRKGWGVCTHHDITLGWGVGTHTDCGDHFPLDRVIARAIQISGGAAPTNGDDDVLKDQRVTNPVTKTEESLDVTIAYMEERIVGALKAQLPALVAKAVLDSTITSEVDHKTQGTVRQFLAWIDRNAKLVANKQGV